MMNAPRARSTRSPDDQRNAQHNPIRSAGPKGERPGSVCPHHLAVDLNNHGQEDFRLESPCQAQHPLSARLPRPELAPWGLPGSLFMQAIIYAI